MCSIMHIRSLHNAAIRVALMHFSLSLSLLLTSCRVVCCVRHSDKVATHSVHLYIPFYSDTLDLDVTLQYLNKSGPVYPAEEGRINFTSDLRVSFM